MISKAALRETFENVLEEEMQEATDKERRILVDALLGQMEVDFDVQDDEDEEASPG